MVTQKNNDVVGQQIAALKKSEIAQRLDPGLMRFAVYMMRRFGNSDGSMFPNQGRTLAPKFGVCRKTITRWLRVLVDEGVFTVERRCRGLGGGRGRTSNVYRFNPACLTDVPLNVPQDVPLVVPLNVPTEVLEYTLKHGHAEPSKRDKNLEDVDVSVGGSCEEGSSPSLTSLLSTDHEPSGEARTSAKVLSARERARERYDAAYTDSDLDYEEFDRRWLLEHPEDADIVISGNKRKAVA